MPLTIAAIIIWVMVAEVLEWTEGEDNEDMDS